MSWDPYIPVNRRSYRWGPNSPKPSPSSSRSYSSQSEASAAYESVIGTLLDNPHRIGKQLQPPLADRYSVRRGTYRAVYRIDSRRPTVTVLTIMHRSDAYRPWAQAAQQAPKLTSGMIEPSSSLAASRRSRPSA